MFITSMKVRYDVLFLFSKSVPQSFLIYFPLDSIDCGVKVLKCCNTPFCRRMATMTWFLTVLVFIAITQGICEKYIIVSAQQAALEHDYDPKIVGAYSEMKNILV